MDRVTLDGKHQKVVTQRNVFLFFSSLLAIAVVLLSGLLFLKQERIVIVPPLGPTLWIEDNQVSDTYLDKFGSYIADLLLTRTPADVDRKNRLILEYIHPAFYHDAKKQLQQDKERILKSNQSLLFRTGKSTVDSARCLYVAEGELLVFVGRTGEKPTCAQTEQKRFIFEFQCHAGKLLLKSLHRENL